MRDGPGEIPALSVFREQKPARGGQGRKEVNGKSMPGTSLTHPPESFKPDPKKGVAWCPYCGRSQVFVWDNYTCYARCPGCGISTDVPHQGAQRLLEPRRQGEIRPHGAGLGPLLAAGDTGRRARAAASPRLAAA
ncbi:hypothetical protein Daudx_1497 [Candidatus Desulforudis audaxviator]|nr:hypothetical protein Daudx_1497 [Candidatus Desulforudis audaxviator]